jgi:hypothetical protein
MGTTCRPFFVRLGEHIAGLSAGVDFEFYQTAHDLYVCSTKCLKLLQLFTPPRSTPSDIRRFLEFAAIVARGIIHKSSNVEVSKLAGARAGFAPKFSTRIRPTATNKAFGGVEAECRRGATPAGLSWPLDRTMNSSTPRLSYRKLARLSARARAVEAAKAPSRRDRCLSVFLSFSKQAPIALKMSTLSTTKVGRTRGRIGFILPLIASDLLLFLPQDHADR